MDALDWLALLGQWGRCPRPPAVCSADLNGDMVVDALDLLMLIEHWTR